MAECAARGVSAWVVNGTCVDDWGAVRDYAASHPGVILSFGWHPWFLDNLPEDWCEQLVMALDSNRAAVGEIGLDSWRKPFDRELQERVFSAQLQIAAERNLPVSIHGLRAWDRVLSVLKSSPRPACGFLLHSYGGPSSLIEPLAELGAYFSCPGFFLRRGNEGKLALFKDIPLERLLIESDAPDQALPEELDEYKVILPGEAKRINHPASIIKTYKAVADLRSTESEDFINAVGENFRRLFGSLM
jgi:TatD DNase family protein